MISDTSFSPFLPPHTYTHTHTHTHTRTHTLPLLGALQGGSTVLKKIFPKALIWKTMVLVNSSPPPPPPPPSPRSPLQPEKNRQKTQRKSREAEACCSNDWAWVRTLFTYRRTTQPFPAPSLLISLSVSRSLFLTFNTQIHTHSFFNLLRLSPSVLPSLSLNVLLPPPPPPPPGNLSPQAQEPHMFLLMRLGPKSETQPCCNASHFSRLH